MHVIIRRATSSDADAAAELYVRARRAGAAAGAIPPLVHDDREVRSWVTHFVIPRLECWLAERESGVLVGMLVLEMDWIDQLYVDPDRTGAGIGAELIAVAKRRSTPDACDCGRSSQTSMRSASTCATASRRSNVGTAAATGRALRTSSTRGFLSDLSGPAGHHRVPGTLVGALNGAASPVGLGVSLTFPLCDAARPSRNGLRGHTGPSGDPSTSARRERPTQGRADRQSRRRNSQRQTNSEPGGARRPRARKLLERTGASH